MTQRTFADAAASYVANGGEEKYLSKILALLGNTLLSELYPFEIRQAAERIYPGTSGATKNRQVITPVRAVMNHAYDRGWTSLIRIRAYKQDRPKRKKPASQIWLYCFIRQAEKDNLHHLAALVLFMATTGARVAEAVALRWSEVDFTTGTATLLKTKTETNSVRTLTNEMLEKLRNLREMGPCTRVFRYTSRFSINERIRAVCRRANIIYKPSHTCGRHSFATNAVALGADIKTTMDAGGWRSVEVFVGTYLSPRAPGRRVVELFNTQNYDSED